ncbi:hypothetical protein BC938DRAFT_475305 [Jimgerdemannia flammicorona]|uniref:Uncharacterized protein n=1 Tax=Jimgerdemannia flammicorona TaxID=994334 RepID=A0A433PWZ1_9FUNG|nr:hypothetical protein BC938DRAFT_475305 [Jimgerdemannia flammicorona]
MTVNSSSLRLNEESHTLCGFIHASSSSMKKQRGFCQSMHEKAMHEVVVSRTASYMTKMEKSSVLKIHEKGPERFPRYDKEDRAVDLERVSLPLLSNTFSKTRFVGRDR